MQAHQIRRKFIDFFVTKHAHAQIPSASVIPENDPTVLFTTAGMHPLITYLMGETHPKGTRVVNYQKCLRTDDIDEVGDKTHCTFFEMLGNWSFGDYFKKESIEMSYEFLTSSIDSGGLGIDMKNLAVSCFAGDSDAPKDEFSAGVWRELGVNEKRIAFLGKKDNWWGPAGLTGPCGADTEIFYWTGEGQAPEEFDPENDSWVEIWNNVFMEFNKTADGKYEPLAQKNVDTGMGLERITAILQGKSTHYETELFMPIIENLRSLSKAGSDHVISERVIADHLRAAVFIIGDPMGITPSNTDQGYILRRLIRRAIRHGKKMGIEQEFMADLAQVVIGIYEEVYPELKHNALRITDALRMEEKQFSKTLAAGEKEFEKLVKRLEGVKMISGMDAFNLFETYGFPLEMTKELAAESNLEVDEKAFDEAYKAHQEKSRLGADMKFAGGLADHSLEVRRLHTATHLLHQALRDVLGDHVRQMGSNITSERLRFDFAHEEKMTPKQIKTVEEIVNREIQKNSPISSSEMTVEQAKAQGAIGLFEDKYGELVKVYKIGDYSKEICGGPHAESTGELGQFKIKKEEASSKGVRRIKAVCSFQ
jgi:alanyl-tRNA synthetase